MDIIAPLTSSTLPDIGKPMGNTDSKLARQNKTSGVDQFRRVIWSFAIAETIIWAAFYYSFPALLPEWERSFGWTKADLSLAFTSGLIVCALLAPTVGKLIDRGYSLLVYFGSTILGIASLLLLSTVHDYWQFYTVWLCIGTAMSGSLYEPCFAIITRITGKDSKWAITRITLLAGLAGTVSFPSAHALTELFGWRTALQVFAAAVAAISLPLIWFGCKHASKQLAAVNPISRGRKSPTRSTLISPLFWLLAIAFTAINITHGMLLTHLLPILDDRGVTASTAVLVAAMIGPMQVTGRIAMMGAERRISTYGIAISCFLIMICAGSLLLFSNGALALIFTFVILYGAAYGVTTIVRPVITADVFGRESFGAISGMLALPFMFGTALSPTIAALIWSAGGYDMVIMTALGVALFGLIALLAVRFAPKHSQP